jgi:hypothetical protein
MCVQMGELEVLDHHHICHLVYSLNTSHVCVSSDSLSNRVSSFGSAVFDPPL